MRNVKRISICLALLLATGSLLRAQIGNAVYFMQGVPQSNQVNPARHPACGFYLGFPALSPVRTQLYSSSLAFDDVIYKHPAQDSLITFLHPLGDKQAFLDQLKPLNYLVADLGTSLISFGFNTKIGFFSMDLTTRAEASFYFPGDLARLVLEGADEGETYTFDGLGTDVTGFDQIALGWSGAIGNKVQIGVRGKALFGLVNLATTRSDLSISTSRDVWNLQSDMAFKASLPFAEVQYDEDGFPEEIIINEDLENMNPWEIFRLGLNTKNFGLGVDLGVDYRPSGRWLLSASVLDLGYIHWADEVHEVSYQIDYDYTHLEVNPLDFLDEDNNLGDHMDSLLTEIADTLKEGLEFTPGGAYSRRLNTKVYLGASWDATPNISLGLLSKLDFLSEAITPQFTASANFHAGRILHFTLSYSYINQYFKNIGAGISLNAGPFNLYVISDNALNAVFWPQELQSANLWVGLNLMIGYKQFLRVDSDRPLVY